MRSTSTTAGLITPEMEAKLNEAEAGDHRRQARGQDYTRLRSSSRPDGADDGDRRPLRRPRPRCAPAMELRGIEQALRRRPGQPRRRPRRRARQIHGIVGENGAGKSTLMNILYGFYQADSGEILVDGQPAHDPHAPGRDRAGIGMVHQHFMLVEPFTVLENLLLGAEGGCRCCARASAPRAARSRRSSATTASRSISTRGSSDLPVGVQQRVEILKALFRGAHVLILDEPTGVLTPQEADHLFRILRDAEGAGRTVILITHKLREIMAVTENVSVMRAGAMVATARTAATSREELAELMVGRKVLLRVEKAPAAPARARARGPRPRGPRRPGRAAGQGRRASRSAAARSSASRAWPATARPSCWRRSPASGARARGEIMVRGQRVADPAQARAQRPGPRAGGPPADGPGARLPGLGERDPRLSGQRRVLRPAASSAPADIVKLCREWMERLRRPPARAAARGDLFSGGNQQKLVIAREMEHEPDLLLVGQPTRGVDIGAIEFIHKRLVAMRDAGKAVLVVSVELDEILSLSRPHPGDVRRPHRPASWPRPRPTSARSGC